MDLKLVMFKSNGQRKDFPIINPTTILGRGENCDLQIPIDTVSRKHCELSVKDDSIHIQDLGSSNGTYVNNQRVEQSELGAGDRLVVGPIVFTLQVDGQPENIKPVKTRGQVLAEEGQAADDIIELEDDVVAQPGASALMESPESSEVAPLSAADDDDEDMDPISALESLAQREDDEKDQG